MGMKQAFACSCSFTPHGKRERFCSFVYPQGSLRTNFPTHCADIRLSPELGENFL